MQENKILDDGKHDRNHLNLDLMLDQPLFKKKCLEFKIE
jgi:hypothetical protein